jgi:hypothetical protein
VAREVLVEAGALGLRAGYAPISERQDKESKQVGGGVPRRRKEDWMPECWWQSVKRRSPLRGAFLADQSEEVPTAGCILSCGGVFV